MKPLSLQKRKLNYTALAFAIPFGAMLVLMLIRQFKPFGNYSMLYSDMYHQYYPFFVSFRKALLSGQSLLYNWDVGMGMDYLGLISYYLASPLNLLSVLVPESLTLEYFSLLMPIKLGLASMFFAIFLKRLFGKDDLSLCLFGSFYALCAWALGYQWNVMWLDTFALLPLVALGTCYLLRDKKFILYTVSLFLSVATNYYIGFFTCIFVFLVFFCYQICRWAGFKKFFRDLCRIAFFSVLAIGMTAFLTLPALSALQSTQSGVNKFPEGFRLNIAATHDLAGLLSAMTQVAGNTSGGLSPTFKEGLPNLYCGIFTNLAAFLFLTCKQVKLRDKLCSVFLLLFFNVSFIIRQLDYIWHGFHFTNMIPYRFSFLYSFVMLYMAYRAYQYRHRFRLWQVTTAGIGAVSLCCFAHSWEDPVFLAYNSVFLLLYLTVLVACRRVMPPEKRTKKSRKAFMERRSGRRQLMALTLPAVMALELVLNLINFAVNFPGTSVRDYPKGTSDAAAVIEYMHEKEADNLFYRAETTHSQTLNDGALNGYRGVSTFTSSANVQVTKFMQALGYAAKNTYNRYCFEESSPVANLFLGLKYMVHRKVYSGSNVSSGYLADYYDNAYFDTVTASGNVALLENNAYLPLGFLAQSQLAQLEFDGTEPFLFQNQLFRTATGLEGDVWISMFGNATASNEQTKVSGSFTNGKGRYSYTTGSTADTVTISYTATHAGFVCAHLELPHKNGYSLWHNGLQLYSDSYSLPQMAGLCQVEPGDVVEIRISCKAKETGNISARMAVLDEALFRQGYHILNESTLQLTTFKSTVIEGSIDCTRDGLLYTSVAQDGNWQVTVDGEAVQPVLVGNAMVAVELTAGTHKVCLTYRNTAFETGCLVSLGCGLLFALACLLSHLRKAQKENCEKGGNKYD